MTESTYDTTRDEVQRTRLTASQRHRVLADDRRRAVVEVLADRKDRIDLQTLARAATALDDGDGEWSAQRALISLHHAHLPLLDEVGLVDYDAGSHRVQPRPAVLDQL